MNHLAFLRIESYTPIFFLDWCFGHAVWSSGFRSKNQWSSRVIDKESLILNESMNIFLMTDDWIHEWSRFKKNLANYIGSKLSFCTRSVKGNFRLTLGLPNYASYKVRFIYTYASFTYKCNSFCVLSIEIFGWFYVQLIHFALARLLISVFYWLPNM